MKAFIRGILLLGGSCLFLAVVVQLLARGAWSLSDADEVRPEEFAELPEIKRTWTAVELADAVKNHRVHRVEEWPPDKPRIFHEAPELAERVERGELPPVQQRLSEEPLVVVPPDQMGPYGGTWNRYTTSTIRSMGWRFGYERLIRFDPMGSKFVPNLCKKWEMADSGRTWTLHLRKGVRWSDGEPWGADDIMFWYNDILCNDKVLEADIYMSRTRQFMIGGELFKLEKIDDHTIRFRYKEPNGLFLMHMAESGEFRLMHQNPAHYLKQFHPDYCETQEDLNRLKKLAAEKNLAGPYHLLRPMRDPDDNEFMPTLEAWYMGKELVPGEPSVFKRNPYYWKVDPNGNQLPYLDRVVFHKVSNLETINLKAINGQIGMQSRYIQFTSYALLMSKSYQSLQPGAMSTPFRVRHWVGPNRVSLTPNLNHKDKVLRKLLNDKRLRIALSVSINRDEINEVEFFGVGTPRQNCPTRMSRFYSEKLEKAYVKYDRKKANRLLDEMGLTQRDSKGYRKRPDGETLRLNIDGNEQTGFTDALQLVAQYWRAIGIKSEMKIRARSLWFNRVSAGLHDVDAWWSLNRQIPLTSPICPMTSRAAMASQWGTWFSSNGKQGEEPSPEMKQVMDLYRKIERTPDFEKQIELYGKMQEIAAENLWSIGLVGELPVLVVVQERFRNVPEVAYYDWYSRGPGNTAVECYAIAE